MHICGYWLVRLVLLDACQQKVDGDKLQHLYDLQIR